MPLKFLKPLNFIITKKKKLKRMEKMFESFGEVAAKETLPYVDLFADGQDAGETNDSES